VLDAADVHVFKSRQKGYSRAQRVECAGRSTGAAPYQPMNPTTSVMTATTANPPKSLVLSFMLLMPVPSFGSSRISVIVSLYSRLP